MMEFVAVIQIWDIKALNVMIVRMGGTGLQEITVVQVSFLFYQARVMLKT